MNADIEKGLDGFRLVRVRLHLPAAQSGPGKARRRQAERGQHGLIGHDAAIGPQAAVHGDGFVGKRISGRRHRGQHQVLRALNFTANKFFMRAGIFDQRFNRSIGEEAGESRAECQSPS